MKISFELIHCSFSSSRARHVRYFRIIVIFTNYLSLSTSTLFCFKNLSLSPNWKRRECSNDLPISSLLNYRYVNTTLQFHRLCWQAFFPFSSRPSPLPTPPPCTSGSSFTKTPALQATKLLVNIKPKRTKTSHTVVQLDALYHYMRNFCNLLGLEQWYFSLIWNTYMWKLQTLCG